MAGLEELRQHQELLILEANPEVVAVEITTEPVALVEMAK
jgi:hypothetical protein